MTIVQFSKACSHYDVIVGHTLMVGTYFGINGKKMSIYTSSKLKVIHHFRINRSLAGWAHSQQRVGVNITIPLH